MSHVLVCGDHQGPQRKATRTGAVCAIADAVQWAEEIMRV